MAPPRCPVVARAAPAGDGARSFPDGPGTYALILRCSTAEAISVGRLGRVEVARGYYVYVGSAFGPGGLRARVGRHFGTSKRCHWHIDYVRPIMTPVETWFSQEQERREHVWAGVFIEGWLKAKVIDGFGASDCRCPSHLFFMRDRPKLTRFRQALRRAAATEV